MALPTSKQPLPGFRLIADDAGSYIDDVNNIRLGPEFVLTRNAADPSAAVSVSAYIAAQIAAATAAFPVDVVMSQAFSAGSITIPFTANKYKRLDVNIDVDAGTISTIALTGMAAGSYGQEQLFGSNSTAAAGASLAANSWAIAPTTGRGTFAMVFSLPPAPALKGLTLSTVQLGGTTVGLTEFAINTDAVNDPTGIVLTLNASHAGYIYAIGYK
jgi:hypothetical protein